MTPLPPLMAQPAMVAPAPSLESLIQAPELSRPAISPDGKSVAYRRAQAQVAANTYALSWWIAPTDGSGPPRQLADGGGPLWVDAGVLQADAPQWSPDSRSIYFRALIKGQVQVWRASVDGAGGGAVTHDPADVESFRLLDAHRLAYRAGATRAEILQAEADQATRGVRIDRTVDVAQDLLHGAVINGRLAAQRLAGPWFTRTGILGDRPPRFEIIDPSNSVMRTATIDEASQAGPDDPTLPRLAPAADGEGREARLHGSHGLEVMVPGKATVVLHRRFPDRIANFQWRPGRNELVVTTYDPAIREQLWLWDLATDEIRRIVAADGTLSDGGLDLLSPCPLTGTIAVCVAAGPLTPSHLVRIDLDTGAEATLSPVEETVAAASPRVEARALVWRDVHGHEFGGVLMTPVSRPPGPLPLVVVYYSCEGYLRGGVGDEWPLAPLAARGFATLCINQTQSLSGPQKAVATYRAALSGIQTIVGQLSREGIVDPHRVGMGGLSFGSEVVMWAVTHSKLLAAASISSVQLAPIYYWFNGVAGRTQHETLKKVWGLGDPDTDRAAWRKLSPALEIEKLRTPLLMQMPEQEFRYQMELDAKLSNTPLPVDLFAFPDEPHIKTQPAHRLAVYRRNIAWFSFWLKGEIDPDPPSRDEVARWAVQRQVWLASPRLARLSRPRPWPTTPRPPCRTAGSIQRRAACPAPPGRPGSPPHRASPAPPGSRPAAARPAARATGRRPPRSRSPAVPCPVVATPAQALCPGTPPGPPPDRPHPAPRASSGPGDRPPPPAGTAAD